MDNNIDRVTLDRLKDRHVVSMLDQHEEDIWELLSHGAAKAAIVRMHGCSWQTVHNWVNRK